MLVMIVDMYSKRVYTHSMMNTEQRFTATKIDRILRERGIMQTWIARELGVAPATVNRWVKGERSIDLESANRISELLNIPFYLLFDIPKGVGDARIVRATEAA